MTGTGHREGSRAPQVNPQPPPRTAPEEEVFAGGDPAVLIEREHSFWEEAMEVEVVLELLIPGMQDTDKAWGSPKVSASEG